MLTIEQTIAVTLAATTLALIPGPDTALILARSVTGGKAVGFATALGCTLALGLHTLLAVLGLSVILTTSAVAFAVVKLVGAGYLIFLGVQAFKNQHLGLESTQHLQVSSRQALVQGFFSSLFNPKVALFFLSFLPQFVQPEHGAITGQFLLLGLIASAVTGTYAFVLVAISGAFRSFLVRKPQFLKWQNRTMATIFVALGLKLATTTQ